MNMSNEVVVETTAGILALTLSRPEKRNALTGAMYQRLAEALEQANADATVRVVLIDSTGADFCAGNDIADFVRWASSGQSFDSSPVLRFLRALVQLERPLVAAVRGRAIGIGLTLLLHCDLVYLAADARLSAPFVDLALVPEAASSWLLPMRLGHARCFALFALGQALSADDAVQAGIANASVPAESVSAAARSAASTLAIKPAQALQDTKTLMRSRERILSVMDHEAQAFVRRLLSAEAQDVFKAFMARKSTPG